jgi:hypothetical protein
MTVPVFQAVHYVDCDCVVSMLVDQAGRRISRTDAYLSG